MALLCVLRCPCRPAIPVPACGCAASEGCFGLPVRPRAAVEVEVSSLADRRHRSQQADQGRYSMTTTTSPEPTVSPGVTLMALTVPAISAAMLFSIFIASSTTTV